MPLMFGRQKRAFDPRIPHYSALRMHPEAQPTIVPTQVHNAAGLPDDLGMMLNDTLGDCTCAAVYHAIQVWTRAARGVEITEPNAEVQLLYQEACGYVPGDPSTDQGGVEQDVLTYLLTVGAPIEPSPAPRVRHKILAFVEVDPRVIADVQATIFDCGLDYIGFQVPDYLMAGAAPPDVWDVNPAGNNAIVGAHAVILVGYDAARKTFDVISWGRKFTMSEAFFTQFVEEVYTIADPSWIESGGGTPAGLTVAQLEAQMEAKKRATA